MWPWRAPARNLAALLDEAAEDRVAAAGGDFWVTLGSGFKMTPELLAAAIPLVKRLVVYFAPSACLHSISCPEWIFSLTGIIGLCMNNYPFLSLPDEIGALTRLKHLHMYGSALARFPRTVRSLVELEELDLYASYGLHYLPFEVLACPRLQFSRFSTYALLNNSQTKMSLPELPDWCTASAARADDSGCVARLLARARDLPEVVAQHLLSFLPQNRCSICTRCYLHDLGCYVWSHHVVGTDAQALLAFCCSRACAGRVQQQVRYHRESNCNERLVGGEWQSEGVCSPSSAVHLPALADFYQNFSTEHLLHWDTTAVGAVAARDSGRDDGPSTRS
mmetsp:Transcript_149937/g.417795  ORF Transcript_149937/g.417795 Transcript_149937/m.417795 type:complete len:335 (+) Transcript_149937:67-1071(+)